MTETADPPVATPAWRSLRGLRTALTALFAAAAVAYLGMAGALAHRVGVVRDLRRGLVDLTKAKDADDLVAMARFVAGVITLAIVVVFIVWLRRAALNNDALARSHPRFRPGWAVGSWFIPIANLVLPVLIVQDLWRGSDAGVPRGDPGWRSAPGSALVGWWWGVLLASLVRYWSNVEVSDRTLREIQTIDTVAAVGALFTVVSAVLGLAVVRSLTERQENCLRTQQDAWRASEVGAPS